MKQKNNLISAVLIASIMLLQGCAAGLLGNGANKPPPRQQDRSIDQVTQDGNISSAVSAQLRQDRKFNGVNVSTFRGVVTLHGRVNSRDLIDRAVRIAQGVDGVKRVVSKLGY